METLIKKIKPDNIILNQETMQGSKNYTDKVIKFAFTLSGFSSKAYNFVRETFGDDLPCVKTIQWYLNKLNVHPWFRNGPFDVIEKRIDELGDKNEKLYLAVLVDDVSIRD